MRAQEWSTARQRVAWGARSFRAWPGNARAAHPRPHRAEHRRAGSVLGLSEHEV